MRRARIEPRPLVPLGTLLRGKQPKDALQMIPMIFSLCGQAQAAAAATAIDAAAHNAAPSVPLWRERRVLTETLQELLWRLLLDLPRIMHAPAHPELLASLRRRLADCWVQTDEPGWQKQLADLEHAVGEALLGSPARLNEIEDADALLHILKTADTATARLLTTCWNEDDHLPDTGVPLMPFADRNHALTELAPSLRDDAAFPLYPHWQGRPAETGALARMQFCPPIAELLVRHGPSPGLRLFARLLEIRELFSRLRAPGLQEDSFVQGAPYDAGVGVAWVQNARGLLLHRAVLDKQGTIEDYCLVAPTEWNFHPEGPYAQGLKDKPASTRAQALHDAELLAHSLDPCVAYQIEVDHA